MWCDAIEIESRHTAPSHKVSCNHHPTTTRHHSAQATELGQLREKVAGSCGEVATLRGRLHAQEADVENLVTSLARVTEKLARLRREKRGGGGEVEEGVETPRAVLMRRSSAAALAQQQGRGHGQMHEGEKDMAASSSSSSSYSKQQQQRPLAFAGSGSSGDGGGLLASSEDPLHAILTRGHHHHQQQQVGGQGQRRGRGMGMAASGASTATAPPEGEGGVIGACGRGWLDGMCDSVPRTVTMMAQHNHQLTTNIPPQRNSRRT